MAKKATIPFYEQMLLNIGSMTAEQLQGFIACAKVTLRQKQPRVRKAKPAPVHEKAS